jgi:FkbM family methyltransferase
MLTERIVSQADIDERLSHIAALNTVSNVLYGAGLHASEIEAYLRSNNINVSGCFVDDDYLNNAHRVTLPVESYNSIKERFDKFNIIVAFCRNPVVVREELNRIKGAEVNSVQFIDCRFWQAFETIKLSDIKDNLETYEKVYLSFSDDISKDTYVEFINAKLLRDATKLSALYSQHQYFPSDLPMFAPTLDDVFVDGGAFTGDTLEDVLAMTGGKGCTQYYAFEPDEKNAQQLQEFVHRNNLSFVTIQAKGLWSHLSVLSFSGNTGSSSSVSASGDMEIEVDAIDRLNIPATFIKMDIEGAEYKALTGAEETIRKHRPNLAIALYHKPVDLLKIPTYVKSLCPDYRLYLRIHGYYSEELVLYATVRD